MEGIFSLGDLELTCLEARYAEACNEFWDNLKTKQLSTRLQRGELTQAQIARNFYHAMRYGIDPKTHWKRMHDGIMGCMVSSSY